MIQILSYEVEIRHLRNPDSLQVAKVPESRLN
jgi:hypothetical protein